MRGIDADHGATPAAGCNGHVALNEEGETAEHLLPGQLRIAADELADALGGLLVVGHDNDRLDGRPRRGGVPALHSASDALGHVGRPPHLRLCRLLPALVSPLFPALLPLLPILQSLILTLAPGILILLGFPITPMH